MSLLFGFDGRIGRGMWWLSQAIIFAILITASVHFGIEPKHWKVSHLWAEAQDNQGLLAVLMLCFWLNLVATIKRFHDRDKSGFWFLMSFVPFVGSLWVSVECGFFAGTLGTNSYGPSGDAAPRKSASSGIGREPSVQADLFAYERLHRQAAQGAAAASRASNAGYAMRAEPEAVRTAPAPQSAPGFGRRNGFR